MSLSPGDRVDRYEVLELLGSGGMGQVYRARDLKLERLVALKILRVDRGLGTDGGARLLREARAAAALSHPNVLAVFDVGEVAEPEALRGLAYIAMELVVGKSLKDHVGDGSVPIGRRVEWMRDVAKALAAAHEVGIVHRDVKPENVMVRFDGVVKVLDFGIARRSAASLDAWSSTEGHSVPTMQNKGGAGAPMVTAPGAVVGTPFYMAPEQLRGEVLDGRADQFAWGVVAYEVLTGAPPWRRTGDALAVASEILSGAPASLRERGEIPGHVAGVVMRALSKDRGARFASMEEVVKGLEGGGEGSAEVRVVAPVMEVEAPQTAAVARTGGARQRRGGWVLGLGMIAVGMAAAGGVKVYRGAAARASSAAGAVAVKRAGCALNAECVESHGGEPWVCRKSDGSCVAIASEDCKAMFEPGDLTAEDTLWLGVMLPMTGRLATSVGTMNMEGVDLARHEIAEATSAFVGKGASQRVRRIALVGCDDAASAMRAAHHLVDDVGVPAIAGFRSGQELVDLAGSFLIQRGVISLATLTVSSLVTRLPQPPGLPRMVWRTTYSHDAVAEAAARFVHDVIEPQVERAHFPTRVTLARGERAGDLSLAEAFYRQLTFNGKSALENGRDYQEVTVDTSLPEAAQIEAIAERVVRTAPTIVILAEPSGGAGVLAIEARWQGPAPRPTYLLTGGVTQVNADFLGESADRRRRVFGVESLSNSTANARFVIRFNQTYTSSVSRAANPGNSYDAIYLLAYATFALRDEHATGASLARAFARLIPPGRSLEVGSTNVFDALTALSSGENIDLAGTQSGLDFDLATGEAPSDFALTCPGIDATGRASGESLESGLVFRARSRKLEGVARCP